MRDKKNILIAALLFAIVALSVGYATLSQNLTINGTASIKNWDVEIVSITPSYSGNSYEKETTSSVPSPSFTATTATFNTVLSEKGDYATYVIEIENKGSIDAKLNSITFSPINYNDSPIRYVVESAPVINEKLVSGAKTSVTIKVEYNQTYEGEINSSNNSKSITGTIEYVQDE